MKRTAAFFTLVLCLMFFSACLDFGPNSSEDPAKNSEQKQNTVVPSVSDEPVEFNSYALQAGGTVLVKGTLETEGPLADIYSGTGDAKIIRKGSVSGNIYSSKNSLYKTAPVKAAAISKSSLNERSLPVFSSYYLLHEDGTAEKITEGNSADISADSIPAKWEFSEGTWNLSGSREKFYEPMVICGNLHITGNPVVFHDQLYVTGNITSEVYFEVSLNDPFSSAIVSGGSMNVQSLTVTGKIETAGDLSIGGSLDITGCIAAGGNVLVEGNAKIGYYDTLYKAAAASAREEFDQEDADSKIMLVHSQIFKNLKGRSEVAMFTFAKGYRTMTEDTLLMDLQEGYTDGGDYFTRCCGASMNYGTVLSGSENLSEYYRNKLHVLNWLSEAGHDDVTVTEALYLPTEKYYLTFADSEGKNTGTYLISAPGLFYGAYDIPVELTNEDRIALLEQMNELENAGLNADEERDTDISSMTDEELAELGLTREIAQMTAEEMRTEEWRRSKRQYLETEEVEAELVVWEEEQSKKFGKKLKRAVKKVTKKVTQPVMDTGKGISNFFSNEVSDSGIGHFFANVGSDVWNNITQFIENDLLPFIYHTAWRRGFINGVKDGTYDDEWTKKIHMNNYGYIAEKQGDSNYKKLAGSCGYISAAMILYYHDKINYKTEKLNMKSYDDSGREVAHYTPGYGETNTEPGDPLGYKIEEKYYYVNWIKDSLGYGGSVNNKLDDRIEHTLSATGFKGSAKFLWWLSYASSGILSGALAASQWFPSIDPVVFDGLNSAITAVTLPFVPSNMINSRQMFNDVSHEVRINQPPVISFYGYYKGGPMDGHSMPVIGYKIKERKVFNIDTVLFDECYVYTDTTWSKVNEYGCGAKKFWRIDPWSGLGSGVSVVRVRVNGPNGEDPDDGKKITAEVETESGFQNKSEIINWYLLINGERIPDYYNAVFVNDHIYVFRRGMLIVNYIGVEGFTDDRGYILKDAEMINDYFPDADYTLTGSDEATGWCRTGGKCAVPTDWMFVKIREDIWAVRADKLAAFAEKMHLTELPRI